MPKFKNYTAKLVERQIRAIIRRNPNNVNPSDGNSCLYHKGGGANKQRCLIGQWGFEQGFSEPDATDGNAQDVVEDLWSKEANFEDDAANLMLRYQRLADTTPGAASFRSNPRPWGEILS